MNNWETSLVPTRPWRSAMSIPRVLSLRKSNGGFKLIQKPVAELAALRENHFEKRDAKVGGVVSLTDALHAKGIRGDRVEIRATIDVGDSDEVGFKLRTGAGEETIVGFDTQTSMLFIDRTNSGDSSFHEKFAGKHCGPLVPDAGTVKLRIFVDESSVELFGGDGETILTDRIFPAPKSCGISMYSQGGSATFVNLDIWSLKSVWQSRGQ